MAANRMALAFALCVAPVALAGRPPAVSGPGAVVRLLSEDPRIEYRESFLDSSQVSALRALAQAVGFEASGREQRHANGGDEVCVVNRSLSVPEDADFPEDEEATAALSGGWLAIDQLQRAAAEWAGMPTSQAMPVVARWEPWTPGPNLNRSGMLHLDARLRPLHRRTVLAYISGTRSLDDAHLEAADGSTVFPCVETEDMEDAEAARRLKMCTRAGRLVLQAHEKLHTLREEGLARPPGEQLAFLEAHPELLALPLPTAGGARPADWQWTAAHDAVPAAAGTAPAGPLHALAEAMCRGEAPGLRVPHKAGAALLIDAATRTSRGRLVPNFALWHAGCAPSAGRARRWTVLFFFDQPSALGGKAHPVVG